MLAVGVSSNEPSIKLSSDSSISFLSLGFIVFYLFMENKTDMVQWDVVSVQIELAHSFRCYWFISIFDLFMWGWRFLLFPANKPLSITNHSVLYFEKQWQIVWYKAWYDTVNNFPYLPDVKYCTIQIILNCLIRYISLSIGWFVDFIPTAFPFVKPANRFGSMAIFP